ncbi:hypothetical protein AVEN_79485-1 [Araneus ventricosus]|uniref:Integrase zinc-binding domain-containing protein n=1 Tax=Araneus ventricosus TaxID=182803 RepID=A0A4Y2L7W7_ARAVE|nr:hypothetical protein AVEN_79485-1 [Araneus ventricosus]
MLKPNENWHKWIGYLEFRTFSSLEWPGGFLKLRCEGSEKTKLLPRLGPRDEASKHGDSPFGGGGVLVGGKFFLESGGKGAELKQFCTKTHDNASGGHFGVIKTLNRTRERFYWDRFLADVEKWCRECEACRARKGPKTEQGKSVTERTPVNMRCGRAPRLPCDILFGRPGYTPSSLNEDLDKLEARLESVQTYDRERIKLSTERKKTCYHSTISTRVI